MNYLNCCDGRFVRRVNRFIAEVEVDGQIEIAHVKNTGRGGVTFAWAAGGVAGV